MRLYSEFVDSGYSPLLFWDLSLGEAVDCVKSYIRRIERETKTNELRTKDVAAMLYVQSMQIVNMLSHSLKPEESEILPLSFYYPELFKENGVKTVKEANAEEAKRNREIENHKAMMDDFIFRHNRAFKLKQQRGNADGRNDAGKTASDNRGTDKELSRCNEECPEPNKNGNVNR